MKVTQLYIVRHLLIVTYGLIGVTLLAIGANAALDLRTSEAAKVVPARETASAIQLALIIGNGNYPDAAERLDQPINDASGLAYAMRRHGFDVDVVEDATKADMAHGDSDPFNPDGTNFNLTVDAAVRDFVSGTPSHRSNLCEVQLVRAS